MNLRGQVQLILFVFGLAPLLALLLLNVPMVYERMQGFYQTAYLQNLRAEFNDLEQHLATRKEALRWLAKLPEPGVVNEVSGDNVTLSDAQQDQRSRYIGWLNHVLYDQLDIIEIQFFDSNRISLLTLARSPVTLKFYKVAASASVTDPELLASALKIRPGGILAGSIQVNEVAIDNDPRYFMTLQLVGPMINLRQDKNKNIQATTAGAVSIRVDVSGLARAFPNTTWVLDNGRYAKTSSYSAGSAFKDYKGLEAIFKSGRMSLWKESEEHPMFWVPMFLTETHGPLWVGRSVDPSAINEFNRKMLERLAIIVVVLLVLVWLVARRVANRTSRLSKDLLAGVSNILTENRPVQFGWKKPAELKELGEKLDELASRHIANIKDIHQHTQKLEQSNSYKSEFLANVSHELRTPLNSILLLSSLLSKNGKNNLELEQVQQAKVINNAGNDLKVLIDNILDLSRIEAGRCVLHVDKISINKVVDNVFSLINPQFEEKGLPLVFTNETDVHLVSDADKIKQILLNFTSNALKFSSNGDVSIRVEVKPEFRQKEWAAGISIVDSGIGINEQKLKTIFEAFTQADGSTSRRYGGTGLGLTISRQLALLLEGDIGVTSEQGKGSCFTLYLPEVISSTNKSLEKNSARPVVSRQSDTHKNLAGNKILIIDEDLRSIMALKAVLDNWGIEVMAASGMDEAKETLDKEEAFDFIIVASDSCLSNDLEDLFTGIRNHTNRKARIIVQLNQLAEHSESQCQQAGADAVIYKPLDMDQLEVTLSAGCCEET
ncbi:MAG TPA: response regulator [Gammaproteobacteria bacterium]|nr:response regulator [Gammaproteobacteria bacterium]